MVIFHVRCDRWCLTRTIFLVFIIHSMHSLKDTQFWLCYFLFIVPMLKNDLKLCVNHQFIAPSLYNQITQLIFITDIFRPKIKYNVQRFLAARLVCARSVVFCHNFWQITQRLPGNWRGGRKRIFGGLSCRSPSCVSFSRARFFLCPLLPSAYYAGYCYHGDDCLTNFIKQDLFI